MIHWGLILRYSVYVVLPLVLGFLIADRLGGEMTVNKIILVLAALSPIYAVSWLAYQNFRPRKK